MKLNFKNIDNVCIPWLIINGSEDWIAEIHIEVINLTDFNYTFSLLHLIIWRINFKIASTNFGY